MKLTSDFHVKPRLRKRGIVVLLSLCSVIVCAQTTFLHQENTKSFTVQYPHGKVFKSIFSLFCVKTDGDYSKIKFIANFSYPMYNLTIVFLDTNFIFNSFFLKKKKTTISLLTSRNWFKNYSHFSSIILFVSEFQYPM